MGFAAAKLDSPLRDWTLELIRRLETDIRAVDTEFDDLHIWRDEQIDPTIHISDELRGKVKSSGILLIVMSPRYLTSTWCKDELEWFDSRCRTGSAIRAVCSSSACCAPMKIAGLIFYATFVAIRWPASDFTISRNRCCSAGAAAAKIAKPMYGMWRLQTAVTDGSGNC